MENKRESQWMEGVHESSNGILKPLKDLPDQYLKNIINKYGVDHDVSEIEKELNNRQ